MGIPALSRKSANSTGGFILEAAFKCGVNIVNFEFEL